MIEATEFAQSFTGQVIIPIIAGLVVSAICGGYVAVRRLFGRLDKQDALQVLLATKVDAIDHEVHTNNGSSLKDAVIRTEEQQKATAGRLADHLTDAAYQMGRIDAFMDGTRPPPLK